MNQILYDPTGETNFVFRKPQSLPTNLWDKKVMLFDIGKPRSKEFLDYFEENLRPVSYTHLTLPTTLQV